MVRVSLIYATLAAFIAPANIPTTPWAARSAEGEKYFAFYKPGVDLMRARRDLQECLDYMLHATAMFPPPDFVLLGDRTGSSPHKVGAVPPGGLVGQLISGAILGSFAERTGRGNLRRCMSYKGYKRYAIEKAAWAAAFDSGAPAEPLAALAAGDAPQVEALRP